jgi:hypothetical protein
MRVYTTAERSRQFNLSRESSATIPDTFVGKNEGHRHSGIELLTPAMVHYGRAPAIVKQRQVALDAACQAHPERVVRWPPQSTPVPKEVRISKLPENRSQ